MFYENHICQIEEIRQFNIFGIVSVKKILSNEHKV